MARDPHRGRIHGDVVVGGGLIGFAVAHALAREGRRVRLLERDPEPGQRASSAAAGMLAPQMEGARHGIAPPADPGARRAMRTLALESRERYPAFVRMIEEESGRSVPDRPHGTRVVALAAAGREALGRSGRRPRELGLFAELLDGPAARRLEPALGPEVIAALHLPDDHAVDNVILARAVREAAAARGVVIELGRPVEAVVVEEGGVVGVHAAGETVPADRVVVAAGAWSGTLEGLPGPLPVRPVRGQIAALLPPEPPVRTVAGPGAYCVPREDGRVLVGATMEEAGFEEGVSAAAVNGLIEAATRFLPGLAEGGAPEAWSGLRPATPDGLPVIGEDTEARGLLYATGHFRNGILLAPVTAAIVAALATGGRPPVDPAPFRPDRFAGRSKSTISY